MSDKWNKIDYVKFIFIVCFFPQRFLVLNDFIFVWDIQMNAGSVKKSNWYKIYILIFISSKSIYVLA